MPLKILNSLTGNKETFKPIIPGHVGMYVCGPTVSGESHLGHARPFITFDIVYRYLNHLGYKVRYVRNITDAGHFEEEGREAEDKISKKAVLEKLAPMELVQKYTNLFHWAMLQFNNKEPNIEPTATGHIVEQIEMIKKIINDGFAYESNGSVYFDVHKYNEHYSKQGQPYGILSGRNLDDQMDTTRELDNQDEKRDKSDFALWKKAPPEHIMRWQSPWGEGFPGWHIECSAMATKYLGGTFDIHGGGMDLMFPHHECEIAQSTVCNHSAPVNYWIHNNMITINGKKMGKSYGNQIMLTQMFSGQHPLLEKGYSPMIIRFFILQSHYRSTLDFGNEALKASEKALKRLLEAKETLKKLQIGTLEAPADPELDNKVKQLILDFDAFMDDDFNTAKVLANMFELVPIINGIKEKHVPTDALCREAWELLKKQFPYFIEEVFGLLDEKQTSDKMGAVIQILLDIRKESKLKKDFVTSDRIRNEMSKIGITIKDEKNGETHWTVD